MHQHGVQIASPLIQEQGESSTSSSSPCHLIPKLLAMMIQVGLLLLEKVLVLLDTYILFIIFLDIIDCRFCIILFYP